MILITGGAGYIGSHTVLNLIEKIVIYIYSKQIYSNKYSFAFDRNTKSAN